MRTNLLTVVAVFSVIIITIIITPDPDAACERATKLGECRNLRYQMCEWCNSTNTCFYKCSPGKEDYCLQDRVQLLKETCRDRQQTGIEVLFWMFVSLVALCACAATVFIGICCYIKCTDSPKDNQLPLAGSI